MDLIVVCVVFTGLVFLGKFFLSTVEKLKENKERERGRKMRAVQGQVEIIREHFLKDGRTVEMDTRNIELTQQFLAVALGNSFNPSLFQRQINKDGQKEEFLPQDVINAIYKSTEI